MKDKVLNYWNGSSYRRRSLIVYIIFSILAIISRLLDDKLGMFSSMIAIGFLVALTNLIISIIYTLYLGLSEKNDEKGSVEYTIIVVIFLALVSFVSPKEEKKEEEIISKTKIVKTNIHNVVAVPTSQ